MIPSASGLELAKRCPGSVTIPHRQESNEYSERGTRDHATDEAAINAGNVPEAYTERWPEVTEWRAETSYMYDVSSDTSRFLGVGLKRAYGDRRPFEIPGTIDVEGRGPGILVVIDKKGYEAVTPASRNPQVRFLALAAARVQPADRIEVAIAPALGALDVASVDPVFDLDVIAHETRQLLKDIARVRTDARDGKAATFTIGRWCRWCNAFNDCPKQDELRNLVLLPEGHPEQDLMLYQDPADTYELMQRFGIWYKRLKSKVYAQAASQPIQLRSGKMFGRVVSEGNRVYNGSKVHEVISAHPTLGRDIADKVVEMTVTQSRFENVVKPLVKRGGFAKIKAEVFNEDLATRKKTVSFEEFEAGTKELAAPEDAVTAENDLPF